MYAAIPTADIGLSTLNWITEQLRVEVERRERENRGEPVVITWRRQALMFLAGSLSGVGLMLIRLYA